ncbi:MAG: hypothetical protein HZA50_03295 [Planctomycetes bacterium]|nr:hypothetical protein [Planctomycetota bacterium]
MASAFAVVLATGTPGCKCDSTPPSGGNAQTQSDGSAGQDPDRQIMVLELLEVNTDQFREPLATHDPAEAAPLRLLEDAVEVDSALAGETDAEALRYLGLVLGEAKTPLKQCRLLVIHHVRYEGVGRTGEDQIFYAFADLPARIPLPASPQQDRYEFDPSANPLAFPVAMEDIRLLDPPGGHILLEAGAEEGTVRVRLGGREQVLRPEQEAELVSNSRTVAVIEKPLRRDAVKWDDKPAPADVPEVIRPGRDHGRVGFTTKLSLTNRGKLPLRVLEVLGKEELQ